MKRMKISHKLAIAGLAALSASGTAFAQTKTGINVGEVQKIDPKPSPRDAVKIEVEPVKENISVEVTPTIKYDIKTVPMPSKPYKGKLMVPSLKLPLPELNRNYVKLGAGNYNNIYGEYFYNTLWNRNNLLSIQGKHHSGTAGVDNSRFSDNQMGLYGKKLLRQYVLEGNLDYRRLANRYYATPEKFDFTSNEDSIKQRFNDINVGVGFSNAASPDSAFHFRSGVEFNSFSDKFGSGETRLGLTGSVSEPFGTSKIVVDGGFDFMRFGALGTDPNSRSLLRVNTHYLFNYNGFRINAGFRTANETDSGDAGGFHFYPDVNASYELVPEKLRVFAGMSGDLERTTFRSLAYQNQWLVSDPRLLNANKKLELSGGIRGSLASNLSFLLSVAHRSYENMAFFTNDSTDVRKFAVVYDKGTTVMNLHAELGYSMMEDLNLGTKFDYYNYSVSSISAPFHRPPFTWSLNAKYNIGDKILVGADLVMLGAREAIVLGDPTVVYKLKPVTDANLNVTYSFSKFKGVKAFMELNNLLGRKYDLWNFYPGRGFQINGGLIINFL